MNIQFKGDTEAKILKTGLLKSLKKAFYSSKLCIIFSCETVICSYMKNKLPLRPNQWGSIGLLAHMEQVVLATQIEFFRNTPLKIIATVFSKNYKSQSIVKFKSIKLFLVTSLY